MEDTILELKTEDLHRLLKTSKKMIVVEFYTTSCPNCRSMAPVYEKLAKEFGDGVLFTRINAATNPTPAATYGVMGVPTFKYFCSGRPIGESVGALPKTILKNTITDLLDRRSDCVLKSTPVRFEITGYG